VGVHGCPSFCSELSLCISRPWALAEWHQKLVSESETGQAVLEKELDASYQLYAVSITSLRENVEILDRLHVVDSLAPSLEILACIVLLVLLDVQ
jgi:hypothetical protein